jgi:hypothetical protein
MQYALTLRRWRAVVTIATVLLPAACRSAQAATKVFFGSASKTDTPAKAGQASSEAAAWASFMQQQVAKAFSTEYPCASTLTASEAGAVLTNQYERELLNGGSDPNVMANLAGALGAQYLVNVSVIQSGASSLVTVTLTDGRTGQVTSRQSQNIPVNGDATDALTALAQKFVNSLGSAFPPCPAAGSWKGSVTVDFIQNETQQGATKEGTGELQCQLSGKGSEATCSMHGSATWTTSRGVMKTQTSGQAVSAAVMVSLNNGTLHLGLPKLKVNTSMSVSTNDGSGAVSNAEDLDGGSYDVPASGDAKRQSGSWTQDGFQKSKVIVMWSLTME